MSLKFTFRNVRDQISVIDHFTVSKNLAREVKVFDQQSNISDHNALFLIITFKFEWKLPNENENVRSSK